MPKIIIIQRRKEEGPIIQKNMLYNFFSIIIHLFICIISGFCMIVLNTISHEFVFTEIICFVVSIILYLLLGYGLSLNEKETIKNTNLRNVFLFSGIAVFGIVIWLYVFILFPYEEYDINKGRVSNDILFMYYNIPFAAIYDEYNKWNVLYLPFIPSVFMWLGYQIKGWKKLFSKEL